MKLLERKLKNTSGATMLLGLLFFLLCTIVATVLLVASTVNSGRLSKLSKNDSRYYAVNSAAELLCDSINGKEVTVKLTKVTPKTTTTLYTVDANDETKKGTPSTVNGTSDYSVLLSYGDQSWENNDARDISLLTDLALDLTVGTGAVEEISAWNFTEMDSTKTRDLKVQPGFKEGAEVDVDAVLEADGHLTLILTSEKEGDDAYKLVLTFSPDFQTRTPKSTETLSTKVKENSETSFTQTVVTRLTENKIHTICWNLTAVERGA